MNRSWRFQGYVPYRDDWEHDHCEFCFSKFSLDEGDLRAGYATPDAYHWMCQECFEDFRSEFGWTIA